MYVSLYGLFCLFYSFDDDFKIMISDFGLFKIEEDDSMMVIVCGILGYVGRCMKFEIIIMLL